MPDLPRLALSHFWYKPLPASHLFCQFYSVGINLDNTDYTPYFYPLPVLSERE